MLSAVTLPKIPRFHPDLIDVLMRIVKVARLRSLRRQGRWLTGLAYREIGGVQGAAHDERSAFSFHQPGANVQHGRAVRDLGE